MEIQSAIDLLTDKYLTVGTKRNRKYAKRIILVLEDLKQKVFNSQEIRKIEAKLEEVFGFHTIDRNLKHDLRSILKFLRIEFKITPKYFNVTIGAFLFFLTLIVFRPDWVFPLALLFMGTGYWLDYQAAQNGKSLRINFI